MRFMALAAGAALVLAACGGGEKAENQQAATPESTPAAAPAAAPAGSAEAGSGVTHDVNMVLTGTNNYHYDPAEITIHPGDKVVWHNVSGGPHNVSFWPDSVPSSAAAPLKADMPDQGADLQGPLLTEPNGTYTVVFSNVPTGDYHYYCLPHLAFGMKGMIHVQQ